VRRWLVPLASLALVLALARAAGFATIRDVWSTVQVPGILASAVCWTMSLGVRIASWRLLLGSASPPARALVRPLALGFVLSYVIPAKAGEPVPAFLASRTLGLPLPRTLSVLTAERAAHVVLLLATFAPAAALAAGRALELSRAAAWAAVGLAGALAVIPFTPALLRRAERATHRLPRGGAVAGAYVCALLDLVVSPRRLAPLAFLSLGFWLLQYASLAAILRAGGVPVNLPQAAFVAGTAVLGGTLTLLPLGTQDGISALALDALGVPLARGFALALFHTTLGLACGAAAALLLAMAPARRRP
jgi:uncharacterized membrane protein YbhN (UPF0104 family)